MLQCNPSGRCWLRATAARASSTSREHITTRKRNTKLRNEEERGDLWGQELSRRTSTAWAAVREQDRCSHAVISEQPQFSSPTTAAKHLLFPCTQHFYATDANRAENTQISQRRVASAACFLWLCPLWVVRALSCPSDSSSATFFNMELQLQNQGETGILFHLLLEIDVTFLRLVCFQDHGSLIFKTIFLQYVSSAIL